MKITAVRRTEYKNCPIAIMQFDTEFQYWFCLRNELYQDHVIVIPVWWKKFLWRIGVLESPYTPNDVFSAADLLLSTAIKSIDELLDPKNQKAIEEAKERTKKKNAECIWQVRKVGEKEQTLMWCIKHNMYSHATDLNNPFHHEQDKI